LRPSRQLFQRLGVTKADGFTRRRTATSRHGSDWLRPCQKYGIQRFVRPRISKATGASQSSTAYELRLARMSQQCARSRKTLRKIKFPPTRAPLPCSRRRDGIASLGCPAGCCQGRTPAKNAKIDATTLHHKVMCGYQAGSLSRDAAKLGWRHWSRDAKKIAPTADLRDVA